MNLVNACMSIGLIKLTHKTRLINVSNQISLDKSAKSTGLSNKIEMVDVISFMSVKSLIDSIS